VSSTSNYRSLRGKRLGDFPVVLATWAYDLNKHPDPASIPASSPVKAWWRCPVSEDHVWQARVDHRCGVGSGCPACAGKQVSLTNRLDIQRPDVAAEWHPTRNLDLKPSQVTVGSSKRIWWQCRVDSTHIWQASIASRTRLGAGCPRCAAVARGKARSTPRNGASFADIHPALVAEWADDLNGDLQPTAVTPSSRQEVWWRCGSGHIWKAAIYNRAAGKNCPECAKTLRGAKRARPPAGGSLADLRPDLATQWHPRNAPLTPSDVNPGTNRRVWWLCPVDTTHEWEATVANRVAGRGCPECAKSIRGRKRATPREGRSLADTHSDLLSQWDYERNSGLDPRTVSAGSHKVVWWRCPIADDHRWQAAVKTRTKGNGCPACRGYTASSTNNLLVRRPDLAAQWHPRNAPLTPKDVTVGSAKRVWWRCDAGLDHAWPATVAERVRGRGCPACEGRQLSVTNRLDLVRPDLLPSWHPTKNGSLRPEQLTVGSGQRVWWRCDAGPDHEWIAPVVNRTSGGRGCPACDGKQVSITNSLATVAPKVAATWHPHKNGSLTPKDVAAQSGRRVWWQCPIDPSHEWSATIASRTSQGVGCPFCDLRPRSFMEVRLAYELSVVLPVNHRMDRIVIPDPRRPNGERRISVDIAILTLRLVIEVDGSWWHRTKESKDRKKTAVLNAAGWTVVRVREQPLKPLHGNDVAVPQRCSTFERACLVLDRVAEIYPRYRAQAQAYRKVGAAQREREADEAIVEILGRRKPHS
jgi:hypothetical protein